MVGNVLRVVGMAVAKFGHHGLEGVEHIEIGAGIEIGSGESRGGVQDVEADDAGRVEEVGFDLLGDVEDLALAVGGDSELRHGSY